MIKPKCDKCKDELISFGGLAFSPPGEKEDGDSQREVEKYHLCGKCWKLFTQWLVGG